MVEDENETVAREPRIHKMFYEFSNLLVYYAIKSTLQETCKVCYKFKSLMYHLQKFSTEFALRKGSEEKGMSSQAFPWRRAVWLASPARASITPTS